ncbi:MAG TPA: gluconeogenesis factor YvcK family protein [Gaiellales bacterium]|nr:gluconeogenesis factor YvcK family protein [Gaiellales bacterium]
MPLIPDDAPQIEWSPSQRRNQVRVVCLGGGTGLSMILRGVKRVAQVTAVVTTTDDGGSSGRLRRDFGMPAPGDLRSCLAALAEDESLVGQLFQHRFTTGELAGHSFGNLFLAGLTDLLGSFDRAVLESARVLAVRGRVVPSTTDLVELVARFPDGHEVRGETALAADGAQCERVRLDPTDPGAHPWALQAIARAQLIVMGPGSLFTSTLPPLLVPGIQEAVRAAEVPRIYVVNLLQQPGETEGYRASDHVARIFEHCGDGLVDGVVVSRNRPQHGSPVLVDRGGLRRLGVRVFGARLAGEWQHDPDRLARVLVRLSRWDREA